MPSPELPGNRNSSPSDHSPAQQTA